MRKISRHGPRRPFWSRACLRPDLPLQGEAIFLNHRIRKHFPGNAIHLRLRLLAADTVVQRDFEVLALAQLVDAAVTHLLERAVNGFTLRVENTFLERD